MHDTTATAFDRLTSNGQVKTGLTYLWGVVVIPSAAGTNRVWLYDGTSGAGREVFDFDALDAITGGGAVEQPVALMFPVPIRCEDGLYAVLNGHTVHVLYE